MFQCHYISIISIRTCAVVIQHVHTHAEMLLNSAVHIVYVHAADLLYTCISPQASTTSVNYII